MYKICAEKLVCGAKKRTGWKFVRICWEDSKLGQIFLHKVITGDESWVFDYDPETKWQSEEWHTKSSPRPKKARMSRSRVKTMIIVFFDSRGIVHKEFVPPEQTVNCAFYKDVLERLLKRVQQVRRDICR